MLADAKQTESQVTLLTQEELLTKIQATEYLEDDLEVLLDHTIATCQTKNFINALADIDYIAKNCAFISLYSNLYRIFVYICQFDLISSKPTNIGETADKILEKINALLNVTKNDNLFMPAMKALCCACVYNYHLRKKPSQTLNINFSYVPVRKIKPEDRGFCDLITNKYPNFHLSEPEKYKPSVPVAQPLSSPPSTGAPIPKPSTASSIADSVTSSVSYTAVFDAVVAHDENEVRRLIAAGVDINAKNSNGDTAAILAVFAGHLDCLKTLYDADPRVIKVKTKDSRTLLHLAVDNDQPSMVTFLLNIGADATLLNRRRRAIALCSRKNRMFKSIH